jgi:hypothetical protein
VEACKAFECTRDLVDTGVLEALSELAVLDRQIFHHDDALAHLGIPVGVIALRRRDIERITDEIIEASFQLADVDVAEFAGPVGFHANVSRNAGIPTGFVQFQRQA